MATNFHVGMKVVCIDDQEWEEDIPDAVIVRGMDGLRKGAIYTVRDIFVSTGWNDTLVRLAEIQRLPLCQYDGVKFEAGYSPDRFRPVVTKKSDISVLKAILENPRIPIEA